MTHTGQGLFAALDFNTQLPLQTRIDAVGAACREVAGLHPSSAHAAQLNVTALDALTHALLNSDEHLGEALMALLEALLDKSSDPSELTRRLLQRAELEVKLLRHHGRKLPEPHLERLIVLLVLLLQDNGQAAHLASTPPSRPPSS